MGRRRKKMKGNFEVAAREASSAPRGAVVGITTSVERTEKYKATTRSARAKWVRAKANTSPPKVKTL